MGRQPCCDEREGLKKGPWSADEDRKLVAFISSHGLGCWREVPKLAGLLRCGKSCRLRWINYLRPDLKRGMLSPEEENLIIQLHASYGNKWSRIAAQLPGRTDNEIKNCWNTRIKKKLKDMGIDPVTHRPLLEMTSVNDPPTNQRYETGPPSFIQRTGVNVPPSLGHPPLLHREPANTSAYHYNLMAKRLQEVGLLGTSPNSVMSPPITTSLSHTPPTTKCEDEFSIDYSADSMSHDRSIDSNVQASVHEFSSEEMFPGDTHVMFTGQQNGLHNAPHMLSACQVPNVHEVHMHPHVQNPSHMSHNAPHMCNPPHMLHNAAHLLQNASHVRPHMLCMSQLRASHPVQPMAHVLPAYQLQAASLPASNIEETRMSSSSSRINESIDGCNEGIEGDASAIKEANEHLMTSNYTRNVSPYLNPSMSKYLQEGGVPQASQLYELKHEEATSTGISCTQGEWSNMVSEMMFSEPGEVEPEPEPAVGEIYETSQAVGQHNFSSSCNSLNMGQWSNMDCLWGDPMPLAN